MRRNKILLIAFLFISFYSCKKEVLPIIELTDTAYKIVQANNECASIFLKNYGIERNEDRGFLFIKNYINKLKNSNEDYSRVIMIQITKSGEVISLTNIMIQILPNRTAIVTKYGKNGENDSKVRVKNFDVDNFYNSLDSEENNHNSIVKLLLMDFSSNDSCECNFYNTLKFNEFSNLEDLSFLDKT